jgi:putative heme-binding domain-containing protein
MDSLVAKKIEAISAKLADPEVPVAERITVARNLVSIGSPLALMETFRVVMSQDEPFELKSAIIETLGSSGQGTHLVNMFNDFTPEIRVVAFDQIVKNTATAYSFLTAVGEGRIKAALIGPGDVARLRSHPDKAVSKLAKSALGEAMASAAQREETIAKFLPEVTKPGDAANGKVMFTAACAVCHKFGDVGNAEVGPTLTGMGSHGAGELLVHIIDPNREVDPTYWQWNITTKKGETLAGVITTENRAGLTLRNQGGDAEIRKEDIATRVNTRRSLMPEGLDGLGPEVLRDILTYMTDTDAAAAKALESLPAESTSATGQKFREPRKEGSLRVLIVGAGSSHNFPRDFIAADIKTLSEIKGVDVIGTMNLAEALDAMPKADVLVFSGNHDQWGSPEFQKALHDFADSGKGILLLHAATWQHPWKGYNQRFVTGGTKGHGKGSVAADCIRPANHPILTDVPKSFTIQDESYHFTFTEGTKSTVLIENKPDGKSPETQPALWIVNDPKARIVCYTHGHDDKSHANPAYKTIITNAVKWVGAKD